MKSTCTYQFNLWKFFEIYLSSYFHSKYKRSQAPHVVGHYAAGARLIGLTEKQLQKHMEKIRASNANSTSPYAQPLYNLNPSLAKRPRIGASPLSNCLRGKKGKIRLKIKIDDLRRKSLEAKAANQISVSFDKIFTYIYNIYIYFITSKVVRVTTLAYL